MVRTGDGRGKGRGINGMGNHKGTNSPSRTHPGKPRRIGKLIEIPDSAGGRTLVTDRTAAKPAARRFTHARPCLQASKMQFQAAIKPNMVQSTK